MRKFIRFTLVSIIVLALSACNFPPTSQPLLPPIVKLTVQAQNAGETFNTPGQVIKYSYIVTNTGNSRLAGPVIVTDPQRQITCPEVKTVPNLDDYLDFNESITCTGTYSITQTDLTTGSVTNVAIANVGGVNSAPTGVTVTMNATNSVLKLTKTANQTAYTASGQTITYTYVITNTGIVPLPPSQFMITDNRLGAAFNCGAATTAPLLTNQTVMCTHDYVITPTDMTVASLTNSATASGGGAPVSQAASVTITNQTMITPTPSATPGSVPNIPPVDSTVQHQVVKGEWLIQIARCYGASFEEVRAANPQIKDPHLILPEMIVSVPHVGRVGTIYGRPCIASYTVKTGDTWESIAQLPEHKADVEVLRARNPGALSPGRVLIIPLNSRRGSSVPLPLPTTASPTPTATFTPPVTTTLQQAADINIGPGQSRPAFLAELNGTLYFQADGGDGAGNELWRYDGTSASRVADINNGANGSNPAYLTVYNSALYFGALSSDGTGNELWKYDGTSATRVADIWAGAESSSPGSLIVFNGALYFSANGNDNSGQELWKYDGTTATRAVDIQPGAGNSSPAFPALYNRALYFQADSGDGAGHELWRYDGTTASRVADIWPNAGNSNPSYLAVFGNALYFSANGNDGAGYELWKYDGTTASRVADIWSGTGDANPAYLTSYNGALYFSANGNDGVKLWKYDGASAARVPAINGITVSNPAFLSVSKNAIYFQADGNNGAGQELWRYNNTTG